MTPVDPLASSPSESLASWMKRRGLHPITWLLILAALIYLAGDIVDDLYRVGRFARGDAGAEASPAQLAAAIARSMGYSIMMFGTPATVEFLFRIWRELRIRRTGEGA